eukprot:365879-Chlamydomonas_euryale.AAC.5
MIPEAARARQHRDARRARRLTASLGQDVRQGLEGMQKSELRVRVRVESQSQSQSYRERTHKGMPVPRVARQR